VWEVSYLHLYFGSNRSLSVEHFGSLELLQWCVQRDFFVKTVRSCWHDQGINLLTTFISVPRV